MGREVRKGYDLSFSLGSQNLRLPESTGSLFHFHFGKDSSASSEVFELLTDGDCPEIWVCRAVTAYISAAQRIG